MTCRKMPMDDVMDGNSYESGINGFKTSNGIIVISVYLFISSLRFLCSLTIEWEKITDAAWYASSANSFLESFSLLFGGRFNSHSLPLYSVLISPSYHFPDMGKTFASIKLINAYVMTSAMIPVYLLARRSYRFPQCTGYCFTVGDYRPDVLYLYHNV